ncbi:hypothetical protein LptCag_1063 [Leptospirillum ferriphilum]|uniref:Uncharacterized protein n=1 Tax=Leptospirillum ferriphilum TaxID=178606 RepID=A0A094WCR1_9BACT|nr:hypothetical protein LptCag_1063 [Leptospirillum ferriphilum]
MFPSSEREKIEKTLSPQGSLHFCVSLFRSVRCQFLSSPGLKRIFSPEKRAQTTESQKKNLRREDSRRRRCLSLQQTGRTVRGSSCRSRTDTGHLP